MSIVDAQLPEGSLGGDFGLVRTLFPDVSREDWEDDPEQEHYLTALTSYDMGKIMHEPERIENRKKTILEETQNLAFRNYKAFVQTAECSREIYEKFNDTSVHVDRLLDQLPSFRDSCEGFGSRSDEMILERKKAMLLLNMHSELLEVLEIPQLADSCIRNNQYEEALELTLYVERFHRKHGEIPVVQSILRDVQESRGLMLSRLIGSLREQISLPECLRVVGFLRRLCVYTEVELRIKFLKSRDIWLFTEIDVVEQEDPFSFLSKIIEICRVHVFDIITQYRAVFSDDLPDSRVPNLTGSAHSLNGMGPGELGAAADGAAEQGGENIKTVLTSWANQKISWFVRLLTDQLDKMGDGSSINSLLNQCMYFGMSMGRVGMDFRNVFANVFSKRILQLYLTRMEDGVMGFTESLESHQALQLSKSLVHVPVVKKDSHEASLNASSSQMMGSGAVGSPGFEPPAGLMSHPSLAVLCNEYLGALNELGQCAPASLAFPIAETTAVSLANVSKCIEKYSISNQHQLGADDIEVFTKFCHVFTAELVPHIIKCTTCVYDNVLNDKILTKAKLKELTITGELLEMYPLPEVVYKPLKSPSKEETVNNIATVESPRNASLHSRDTDMKDSNGAEASTSLSTPPLPSSTGVVAGVTPGGGGGEVEGVLEGTSENFVAKEEGNVSVAVEGTYTPNGDSVALH